MSYDVTVIGEIYQDHIFSGFAEWPRPGEEIFTEAYTWELGGGAVTTACALAKLGRRVQLIGVVGAAQFGLVETRLADFGVSAAYLERSERRSGVTVSVSTQQDRTFFTHRGANTDLAELLSHVGVAQLFAAEARHVHLAFPLAGRLAKTLLPVLRQHGATVSLDVGHDVSWLHADRRLDVLRAVDYLLPNEREAALLSGSAEAYLAFCRAQGLRHGVVKLGAAGAVMVSDEREYRATSPAVEVVDTTGAGDAFDAGFIEGLLSGLGPEECLGYACACGALSTRAAGSLMALPTQSEVEALREAKHAA